MPAQAVRAVATALAPLIAERTPIIVCAKGIERGTKKFMSEVIAECAPAGGAGDPVRAEFRRRRGARHADGGDARGGRRRACRRAGAGGRLGVFSALSFERHARRRNRRRGKKCARHRRWRRHRPRSRRQRRGGTDDARFRRTGPLRQGLWREARDHDGPVRSRRSAFDLLQPAVAQFHVSASISAAAKSPKTFTALPGSPRALLPPRCCWRWRASAQSTCRSRPLLPLCSTAR